MQPSIPNVLPASDLKQELVRRKKLFVTLSIQRPLIEQYLVDGWEIEKEYKATARVKKEKQLDVLFEDEVWGLMANLGFNLLNANRKFKINYGASLEENGTSKQIDVFAADDETVLIIECKAAAWEPKIWNFKETIESIGWRKEGILKYLKKHFPNHKVKFILATKNYVISAPDKSRMENFGIVHFDEEAIKYYQELGKHLGKSARFQLLGHLFAWKNIEGIDNTVPAIRGEMGGHTYYAFLIEPEKLLKIGYVLHRNKANKRLMPTYQRLIKKSRIRAVQEFVDKWGFFPNSIIINIDAGKTPLRFDRSSLQTSDTVSRIWVLHLPKTYRSAFIIDGQHRLYGYANSDYKSSHTIPVVAFVDLERKEQSRIFMQINENQKAVSKNLRVTLDSDLLWDSLDLSKRVKALKSQIAQDLWEELASPLYDRVIVGENIKTPTRCITMDAIKIGLDRGNFFWAFKWNAISRDGTFYKGDNDATLESLYSFLEGAFQYLKDSMPEEWRKWEKDNGFLVINAGIESFVRLFSDIADHLVGKWLNPKSMKIDLFLNEAKYYLDPAIIYLKGLSIDEKSELRQSYGTWGRTKYWRKLQTAINASRSDFSPTGLDVYWSDQAKRFNDDSFKKIRDIELFFKKDFKERLKAHFWASWFKKWVPLSVQESATVLAVKKNNEIEDSSNEKDAWDCMTFIDYRKIALYGSNWRDIFEKRYTQPGWGKKSWGKDEKTEWMQKLERIRNQSVHEYIVKEEEYNFLCDLHEWLLSNEEEVVDD